VAVELELDAGNTISTQLDEVVNHWGQGYEGKGLKWHWNHLWDNTHQNNEWMTQVDEVVMEVLGKEIISAWLQLR
jgi:hypothetical protein